MAVKRTGSKPIKGELEGGHAFFTMAAAAPGEKLAGDLAVGEATTYEGTTADAVDPESPNRRIQYLVERVK